MYNNHDGILRKRTSSSKSRNIIIYNLNLKIWDIHGQSMYSYECILSHRSCSTTGCRKNRQTLPRMHAVPQWITWVRGRTLIPPFNDREKLKEKKNCFTMTTFGGCFGCFFFLHCVEICLKLLYQNGCKSGGSWKSRAKLALSSLSLGQTTLALPKQSFKQYSSTSTKKGIGKNRQLV